jgi:hypothetical protein
LVQINNVAPWWTISSKRAGNVSVGDAIVWDFVGHESIVISQRYTHLDSASLRKTLDHLPPMKKS